MWRAVRLSRSGLVEARASFNLLRGAAMRWTFMVMLLAAIATQILPANGFFAPSLIAAVTAISAGHYRFFVSVVPLNMAHKFVRARTL